MKSKFSFLAILFLTVCSWSAPTPPSDFTGVYGLGNDGVQLTSAKHELVVFSASKEAQDYVGQLRTQQYACQNFDARHVKCSRFIKDLQSIGSTFENVYSQYKDEKLEIFSSVSSPELINDAEYITEWKKSQNATWMGQKYTDLFYTIIKDPTLPANVVKMKFTNGLDQRAFFYLVGHVGGIDIAFQKMEVLKLSPTKNFIISENLNCLLEVTLVRQ